MKGIRVIFSVIFFVLLLSCTSALLKENLGGKDGVIEFWDRFMDYACEGDGENVKSLSTVEGFQKIVLQVSEENEGRILKEFCRSYKGQPLEIVKISKNEAVFSIGYENIDIGNYPSGFKLLKIDNAWKLDNYYPPK
ncbi:hypothetical protein [Litoribacter populi]|uniref:hypothetical protein n=1 Tax=Litoribacter populi TaxID=2598460 RepID=UPI00117C7158|nr:hypothetical protein [Litoribacter populi]